MEGIKAHARQICENSIWKVLNNNFLREKYSSLEGLTRCSCEQLIFYYSFSIIPHLSRHMPCVYFLTVCVHFHRYKFKSLRKSLRKDKARSFFNHNSLWVLNVCPFVIALCDLTLFSPAPLIYFTAFLTAPPCCLQQISFFKLSESEWTRPAKSPLDNISKLNSSGAELG